MLHAEYRANTRKLGPEGWSLLHLLRYLDVSEAEMNGSALELLSVGVESKMPRMTHKLSCSDASGLGGSPPPLWRVPQEQRSERFSPAARPFHWFPLTQQLRRTATEQNREPGSASQKDCDGKSQEDGSKNELIVFKQRVFLTFALVTCPIPKRLKVSCKYPKEAMKSVGSPPLQGK